MQRIKAVEAADVSNMLCTCKTQWYIMGMLIIITLGMLYLVTNKLRKSSFFKGHLFSNNTKVLLFILKYADILCNRTFFQRISAYFKITSTE